MSQVTPVGTDAPLPTPLSPIFPLYPKRSLKPPSDDASGHPRPLRQHQGGVTPSPGSPSSLAPLNPTFRVRAEEPGRGWREQMGEGSGQCRWAAGVAAAPGSSSKGGIPPFPAAPTAGCGPRVASRGDAGGGSGSRAAAGPRGSRDSLGQTAAAGAEVSQAGWLPEPDIFGKFQQKQFRSFQKTGRWEKALFGLPPPLVSYCVF